MKQFDANGDFRHATLDAFPESLVNGKWTPKKAGYTLLDEKRGYTGIYLRDENGGLWGARTVSTKDVERHRQICESWMLKAGSEDKRSDRSKKLRPVNLAGAKA